MEMMNNNKSYFMNHNTSVNGTYGRWRQPIAGSNWRGRNGVVKKPKSLKRRTTSHLHRNENVDYGNVMAENLRFQNRGNKSFKWKNENRFSGGGRYKPYTPHNTTSYIHRAKNPRAIDILDTPGTPSLVADRLFSSWTERWGEHVKQEWGVDLHGSMRGLIRLRSPGNERVDVVDGGSSCTGDNEDPVQFERRLAQYLSRYEIILPNCGSGPGSDNSLKTVGEGWFHQISQLKGENLILKQRLFVMDNDMDNLKRRVELLERQIRVNISQEVKESGFGDDVESFRGSVDLCMDEVNAEVESEADDGETFRKVIPDVSEAIVAPHRDYAVGIELDESDDKQVENQHNYKSIGENGLSDCPALS